MAGAWEGSLRGLEWGWRTFPAFQTAGSFPQAPPPDREKIPLVSDPEHGSPRVHRLAARSYETPGPFRSPKSSLAWARASARPAAASCALSWLSAPFSATESEAVPVLYLFRLARSQPLLPARAGGTRIPQGAPLALKGPLQRRDQIEEGIGHLQPGRGGRVPRAQRNHQGQCQNCIPG